VAIKLSSARQIDVLVADLGADRAVTRDTAVARLTMIGARAVGRLIAVAKSGAPGAARAAALGALEAIGDPRARDAILRAVDDRDPAVAIAAIGAARGYLRGRHGAEALDQLTRAALDRSRDESVRVAAVGAVGDLELSTIAPLLEALRDDPHRGVRALAQSVGSGPPTIARLRWGRRETAPSGALETLTAAARGDLPEDPGVLRHAIVSEGGTAPLPSLLRVIQAVREREGQEPPSRRGAWMAARAAAHLALANRGSRLGLYDLRESLESADMRLPVEFLAALSGVGDASCVEAVAAAHARSRDGWWREHLAVAFRAIVNREGLTRRHGVMRKIAKRWGKRASELVG
jgi:HEAT repeat protein